VSKGGAGVLASWSPLSKRRCRVCALHELDDSGASSPPSLRRFGFTGGSGIAAPPGRCERTPVAESARAIPAPQNGVPLRAQRTEFARARDCE
jgi:hypothetical protein